MNEIYQGDNGTSLVLTITDDEKVVDLTGSTVEVVIKFKATGIKKEATIIDAANGKCEVVLSSEDVTKDGIYSLQATVIFEDDRTFSSNVQRFIVNKKIGYVPNVGGSTGNVGDSTINGNIIVNGIEIKVYDDTLIRADINDLKQSQHTHTNKSALDRLGVNAQSKLTIDGVELVTGGVGGSSVSDSSTNGNILVNGSEVQVYDDTQIKIDISNKANTSQLHSHTNKTILDQIEQPYTNVEKNKLANIETGAEVNIVTSVNGQIGDVVIDVGVNIDDVSTTSTTQTWSANKINTELDSKANIDYVHSEYALKTEIPIITDSTTNGNILTNGQEVTVYDDTDLRQITEILSRLGISENGSLIIDGVEQSTGGGSSDMTLVVKDYFEGSTNITKTYTDGMVGFAISNDAVSGGSQLTFTINGMTIPVKAQETYESNFIPYKNVTITTTVPYRATVSMPYSANIDTTAPTNITGLVTSNVSTNGVTLSWNASSSTDTTGYDIYNGTTLITSVTDLTYNITGLTSSTSYTFTVKAKDGSGNIASGVSVTISTIADTVSPNNVTNLSTSNISSTTLTLSWTASTSTDTTGYEVYNGSTLLSTVTETTYNVTGLTASSNYTFTVKAKDAANNIASGASVSVTTSAVADTTAPNNVTNLTTSNLSTTSVTLNWTASSSTDTVGYDIYNGATLVTSTANTSYTVIGLSEKTQYTFTIKAKDAANNVASGTSVTITTVDATAPNNVTNLTTASVTQTTLTLNWTASTSPDIASYDVYQGATLLGNITGTSYNVTGLDASTQYTFTVKSKDATGNVSNGSSVTVTTSNLAPSEYALSFDGTTSKAVIPDSNSLDLNTHSFEIEVYPTDITSRSQGIANKGAFNNGTNANYGFWMFNGLTYITSDGSTFNMLKDTNVQANTWQTYVGTYDGTTLKLFKNGVMVTSQAKTFTPFTNTKPLSIGYLTDGADAISSTNYFSGKINKIRLYNRALTDTEIQNNYNGTVATSGLVSQWLMDENTGTTINDNVGTNHGTLTNTSWVVK